MLRAEQLTPQQVRSNVFVREAVADQLRTARRFSDKSPRAGLGRRTGALRHRAKNLTSHDLKNFAGTESEPPQ
jgi:hypothetical protein